MKPFIIIGIAAMVLIQPALGQKVYSTANGYASFFSKAPISDVDARNGKVKVSLNTDTQELTFDINMKDFEFRNKKMGRDARRKYIEIDKYTQAGFKGKITSAINFKAPGTYPATATGVLTIHGTKKEVTEKGSLIVGKDKIKLISEFNVALKDYAIDTPSILGQEMTEDHVLVKIEANLTAK